MKITDFTLSKHAIDRALDMGIEAAEIRRCLEEPETVERCITYPEFTLYRRGKITCSVGDNMNVATILWATPRGWQKDLKNKPAYEGREYRG